MQPITLTVESPDHNGALWMARQIITRRGFDACAYNLDIVSVDRIPPGLMATWRIIALPRLAVVS